MPPEVGIGILKGRLVDARQEHVRVQIDDDDDDYERNDDNNDDE